jgi:hypothetical protein
MFGMLNMDKTDETSPSLTPALSSESLGGPDAVSGAILFASSAAVTRRLEKYCRLCRGCWNTTSYGGIGTEYT